MAASVASGRGTTHLPRLGADLRTRSMALVVRRELRSKYRSSADKASRRSDWAVSNCRLQQRQPGVQQSQLEILAQEKRLLGRDQHGLGLVDTA